MQTVCTFARTLSLVIGCEADLNSVVLQLRVVIGEDMNSSVVWTPDLNLLWCFCWTVSEHLFVNKSFHCRPRKHDRRGIAALKLDGHLGMLDCSGRQPVQHNALFTARGLASVRSIIAKGERADVVEIRASRLSATAGCFMLKQSEVDALDDAVGGAMNALCVEVVADSINRDGHALLQR